MQRPARILFVVENDHYPRDMRIHNECTALARQFECYVLAPRAAGQRFVETIDSVRCCRYPSLESGSLRSILLEYAVAWMVIGLLVPVIALAKRITVIHVANPPDFIVPTIAWLKLLGLRIVFDMHDLSVETLKGKISDAASWPARLLPLVDRLESLSIRGANFVIATNESILARMRSKDGGKPACVVRNSNPIVHRTIDDVRKPAREGPITIGYFGLLANDAAAGLENIVRLGRSLASRGLPFRLSIVGSGPGLPRLRQLIDEAGMAQQVEFHGFVPIPQAYELIKRFDFGLVAWGDMPKNHLHTAMKVMDYMCCAVPVCSLELKEQLESTGGVGIHAASFEAIATTIARLSSDPGAYEELRRRTLQRFNEVLCWEIQEAKLIDAYHALLAADQPYHSPTLQ